MGATSVAVQPEANATILNTTFADTTTIDVRIPCVAPLGVGSVSGLSSLACLLRKTLQLALAQLSLAAVISPFGVSFCVPTRHTSIYAIRCT